MHATASYHSQTPRNTNYRRQTIETHYDSAREIAGYTFDDDFCRDKLACGHYFKH